ncbi:Homeodomain leucine zipper family IV protein [Zea mays]|uniref:Homeodomain leucine zipper family IV protein n=2 Tax=Zea mays TaxID=4577 RepID=A0A1D6EEL9_MAIZE|nr:Homeodomain leucine zipper family IV protein [Zea mays]
MAITSLLVLDPYFRGKKPRGDYGTASVEGRLDDGEEASGRETTDRVRQRQYEARHLACREFASSTYCGTVANQSQGCAPPDCVVSMSLAPKRSRLPAPGDADELSVIEDQIAWIVHIITSIVKKSPQRGRGAALVVSLTLIKASTSRGLGHLPLIGVVVELVMEAKIEKMKYEHLTREAALAEKELLEEEYKKKFDEAKKELSLENDLAGMWVLVAKLKRGALDISDLNVDD